jgi:hypothetical protein
VFMAIPSRPRCGAAETWENEHLFFLQMRSVTEDAFQFVERSTGVPQGAAGDNGHTTAPSSGETR